MGYLVSRYIKLFPYGTFDAPRMIKTWDESHRLFALNQIREKESQKILVPGLIIKTGHINFKSGGFSNFLSYEIDPKKRKLQVIFFNNGEFPARVFRKIPDLRFLTTLGYFYFTTNPKVDEVPPPIIKVNNLFIYQGQLFQLPVADRSALVVFKNGKVGIPFLKAQGSLRVGQKRFKWRGARTFPSGTFPKDELFVYSGSAGVIEPYNDPIMGPGRLAKKALTPKEDTIDLVVSVKGKKIQVSEIRNGATEVSRGLMILSGKKNLLKDIKKGEIINEVIIDGLKTDDIQDAVSVGPRIFQDKKARLKQLISEGLDDDKALCNRPHREALKLARAFLVKLKNGHLVSVLIDGIPQAGNIYPGVTPQEAADFIFKAYPQAVEVVATDPGGTMKSVSRDLDGKIKVFGNLHYLDYRYKKDGTIDFWPNGYFGRKAVTFLGIY